MSKNDQNDQNDQVEAAFAPRPCRGFSVVSAAERLKGSEKSEIRLCLEGDPTQPDGPYFVFMMSTRPLGSCVYVFEGDESLEETLWHYVESLRDMNGSDDDELIAQVFGEAGGVVELAEITAFGEELQKFNSMRYRVTPEEIAKADDLQAIAVLKRIALSKARRRKPSNLGKPGSLAKAAK